MSTDCGKKNCVKLFCAGGGPKSKAGYSPIIKIDSDGLLSIVHNNEEKSWCMDGFDKNTANMVCSKLYDNPSSV